MNGLEVEQIPRLYFEKCSKNLISEEHLEILGFSRDQVQNLWDSHSAKSMKNMFCTIEVWIKPESSNQTKPTHATGYTTSWGPSDRT